MKKILILIMLLLPVKAFGEAPKILSESLDKYIKEGKSAFLPALVKGSALEGDKTVLAQENMIGQIESYYGSAESWELLASCPFTERFRTTYYIVNYENGPIFGYLNSYMNKNREEIAVRFQFHTEPLQIFPYWPLKKEDICTGG